jgi:hypothetical protein
MGTATQEQFGFTERQRIVGEWLESHLGGYIKAGPITLYGFNAMHIALNIRTRRWGYICFHPTIKFYGRKWPWYFYVSRNATPWLATIIVGPGVHERDRVKAKRRRHLLEVLGPGGKGK